MAIFAGDGPGKVKGKRTKRVRVKTNTPSKGWEMNGVPETTGKSASREDILIRREEHKQKTLDMRQGRKDRAAARQIEYANQTQEQAASSINTPENAAPSKTGGPVNSSPIHSSTTEMIAPPAGVLDPNTGITHISGQDHYKTDPNWEPPQGSLGEINTTWARPPITYTDTSALDANGNEMNPGGREIVDSNPTLTDAIEYRGNGRTPADLGIDRAYFDSLTHQGRIDAYLKKLGEVGEVR